MHLSFFHAFRDFDEFQAGRAERAGEISAQRAYEKTLSAGRGEFVVSGYCAVCDRVTPLKVDLLWGNGLTPNLRERLECATCGLNNRQRAAMDFVQDMMRGKSQPRIYANEQVTAFFSQLRRRFPHAMGSEYLRDGTRPGTANADDIRHEDLTALTFPDASFDLVLSFDVLEHIPDYRRALAEIARVLAPGGHLLASFPFALNRRETEVRASVDAAGSVAHHFPPEYHGDPVGPAGCLCFQIFGWDVLDDLRRAGFAEASTAIYWSADRGYLGPDQLLIIGNR